MKRTIALGAAWTASAAAAVGLGFLAVSLVDASASPGTTPAAATTSPSTGSPTTAPSSGSPVGPSATGQYVSAGGTVFADCATGSPVLAGVPSAGWYVDDSNDPGEMEFKSGGSEVEVHVTCVDGGPVFALDDSSSRSSGSAPAPATSGRDDSGRDDSGRDDSGRDDSSGRDGGHGSDDGPGDDSSGRDGGGHGSDD
ncbi:hypothetical protein [Blastococcus tunisiensis]|uniref:Uncharacterized protein n=1 Tax=Blastococcus tunisiensis TaxID=1798228 RepID=A0A1I2CZS8_9ACTN|nr:hypothetical protein [Blastococcus sp. DSM 46838]SFE73769.1 hypothetical protein SAMN05216574_105237 [Blastococcus sp. DSM 46838]